MTKREVSTFYYDAPGEQRRPVHADVYCRRKRVTFSPLVSCCNITPYAEVYSKHPREFVFDAFGNEVVVSTLLPKVHAREARTEATDISPLQSVDKLTLAERRSLEEEFEVTTSRLRVGRQSDAGRGHNSSRGRQPDSSATEWNPLGLGSSRY